MIADHRLREGVRSPSIRRLPHGHSAITSLRRFSAAHAAYAPLLLNSAGSRPAFDRQSSESGAFRSGAVPHLVQRSQRSEEHTSELQSLMRISYAVFCLKKKNTYLNTY